MHLPYPFDDMRGRNMVAATLGLLAILAFAACTAKADSPAIATGIWVGADVGYQLKTSELSAGPTSIELSTDDLTYGPAIGLQAHVNGTPFVVGLIGSYTFTNAKSPLTEVQSAWSIVGQLGYLIGPATMPYVLAGYTQLDEKLPATLTAFKDDPRGLTLGGGLKQMLTKDLALSLEGRWVDLGKDAVGPINKDDHTFQALLRLSWEFGAKANPIKYFVDDEPPVPAKKVCDKKLANCK